MKVTSSFTAASGAGAFPATQWTRVLASGVDGEEAREALRSLCEAYYAPVTAFLRHGGRTKDAARDLAHGFFEEVLSGPAFAGADRQRGRFRTYLLGALKHYLGREHARRTRLKRGGGAEHVPMDDPDLTPENTLADASTLPPDREFDRQWALHILRGALDDLEAEAARGAESAKLFPALKPFLTGEAEHGALASLAAAMSMPDATLRSHLHRLRRRFRQVVRARVIPTLENPGKTGEEMTVLFNALTGR